MAHLVRVDGKVSCLAGRVDVSYSKTPVVCVYVHSLCYHGIGSRSGADLLFLAAVSGWPFRLSGGQHSL